MMMIRWDESMRRWIWEEVNLLLSWFNVAQGGSRWFKVVVACRKDVGSPRISDGRWCVDGNGGESLE